MKKFNLAIMALALVVGALVYTGCDIEDTTGPVITLQGDATIEHVLNQPYVDPGATALDDEDGDLTANIVVDISDLNVDEVGTYKVSYSVSDAAGNIGTAEREVKVYNEAKGFAGSYSVSGTDGSAQWGPYTDMITASSTINNRVWVGRIGNYNNGAVYFSVSGNTVTIPVQTVNCGNPAANRTFSGSGTITGSTITIDYIESTSGTSITVQEIYTKQ